MDGFTTSEGVTRFLRGKNATPETVVPVAQKLLAGEYSLYLPNRATFVFDLICDRISDFNGKNFQKWKYHPQLWSLWHDVWHTLGKDESTRDIRAQSFRRVKFVIVLGAVLDEIAKRIASEKCLSPEASEMLHAMFQCVDTFLTEGYIDVEEFYTMGLLRSYSLLLQVLGAEYYKQLPIDQWTNLVNRIYELPHQSILYKPSKKSMARYFTEVLPLHLSLFSENAKKLPSDSREISHRIFSTLLFDVERNTLPVHIGSMIESSSESLHEEGILYLFQEVITNLASNDMSACESIYLKLTASKFSKMSEQLIEVLSRVNKTLSSSFFAAIYEKELSQPHPNWRLVSYLLKMDTELAISKWKDVIDASKKEPLASLVLIADNIALGFVRLRDFSLFMTEVYTYALGVSSIWKSPEVVSKLTPKVNELSGNQIARLTKHFLESRQVDQLSVVAQGLLFCSLQKQAACKSLYADGSFCQSGWSEIAYNVLCVFGESIIESCPDCLEKVLGKQRKVSSQMDVNLILRVSELTGDTSEIDSESTLSFIRSMKNNHLIPFASRWIVMLGSIPGAYTEWLKQVFESLAVIEIVDFIRSRQTLICELPLFLNELAVALRGSQPSYTYALASLFPPVVFRKFFGDFLVPMCTDSIKHPENTQVRRALKSILLEPVLNSPFEKDFGQLRLFVATATEATLLDTLAVSNSVWIAHMNSIKTPQSQAYVAKAIDILVKSLQTPDKSDLLLSKVVLSMQPTKDFDRFDQLLEMYVSLVCSNIVEDNLAALLLALSGLPNLTPAAKELIKEAVRKFGGSVVTPETKSHLFSLVTKTSEAKDAYFVVALFVALRQSEGSAAFIRESLLASLKAYLEMLTVEDCTDVFALTLKDLRNAPTEFVHLLVDVGSVLSLFMTKEAEMEHAKLLVAFISAFSERYDDIQDPQVVILFIKTLSTLLAEKSWVFKQYTIELVLSTAHMVSHELDYGPESEQVYLGVVKVISNVVLFHRHRFFSRHHLVMKVFSDLMIPFSNTGSLRDSVASASAYARLLTSLCEPHSYGSSKDAELLTSRAASFKSTLRRHAHILLVNYIYIRLHNRFSGDVHDKMMPGIFSLFALFNSNELLLVNKHLNNLGRAYYHTLYATYKDHGKWKE